MNCAWNVCYSTDLLVIDLSNFGMNDLDGKFLSLMLYTNPSMKNLNLSGNDLGPLTATEFGLGL